MANYIRNIERFRQYLQEQGLYMEEYTRENGVVFRAEQKLDSGTTVTGVIGFYDDSEFVDLYVFDYVTINNPLKKELIYSLINDLNANYRFTKFYEEDNGVSLKAAMMFQENFEPSLVITNFIMLLRSADESYSKFMKVIWS